MKNLIELVEIKQDSSGEYILNSVYINPSQIVFMKENRELKQQLKEGKLNLGLNQNFTNFTNIRMNFHSYASDMIVVGDPGLIEMKIYKQQQRQLLKG
jgi:hypothetical protein